ncbi:MAG: ATP-binding cassette domain-containing protein [Candidatus Hydrogenedens sp.]|nr:ATP-binding cassette domain-containing protein [Candidatus Hydrogenedens sp.]
MADPQIIAKALLGAKDITHSYGSQPVLEGISLTIHDGDRIGLIGRNGCGKSTLMKILADQITPDQGEISLRQGLRVAMLSQQCSIDPALTIGDVLNDAAREVRACLDSYNALQERLATTPHDDPKFAVLQEQADHLHHQLDAMGGWEIGHEIKRVSTALDLPPDERVLRTLSGGELRRVDLAANLLRHPDILLLDEPTNHIDTRSVEWIEHFLERYDGSCVLVTHDRYFLDRVVNRVVELERARVFSFPGNYNRFLEYKLQLEESEARAEANRVSFIRRELQWFRRGAKARSTKQKARIDRLMDAKDSGILAKNTEFDFEILMSRPLGKTVLEARDLCFGRDGEDLIHRFNAIFLKQMRVGILGPNGSGKTTLLKLLMGDLEPRKGKVVKGENTDFLYIDQAHADIDPNQTILDYVSDGAKQLDVMGRRVFVPAYLEQFLFDRNTVYMPIGHLSGGERNRLDLVKKMLRGGNFLVLDEPTNDLDLYSLRVLEEAIENFDGAALIVSHDRYFLNRVCTHLWVFEGNGEIVQLTGNYDDYLLYVQRTREESKERAREEKQKAAAQSAAPAARKLSYKERQELESMEQTILEAESAVEVLQERVQEPALYEQGHEKVQAVMAELKAAQKRAEDLYARWEELEAIKAG